MSTLLRPRLVSSPEAGQTDADDSPRSHRSHRRRANRPRSRRVGSYEGTPRGSMGTVSFVLLVAAILSGGLIALLVINNSLAQGSFDQARLRAESTRLFEQEQAMRQEVERLSSPGDLSKRAKALGLVPAATIAYLDVASGRILGVPLAAGVAATAQTQEDTVPAQDAPEAAPGSLDPAIDSATTDSSVEPESGSGDGATISGGTAYDRAVVSGGG